MSYPTIPNITPHISVTLEDSVNMLLASIAMEEIALSHIMNAEGEKIQFALGTLFENSTHRHCLSDILAVNKDVRSTLTNVIRTEIVLQLKLDSVIDLLHTYHPPKPPHSHSEHGKHAGGGHGKRHYDHCSYTHCSCQDDDHLHNKTSCSGNCIYCDSECDE